MKNQLNFKALSVLQDVEISVSNWYTKSEIGTISELRS